MKDFFMQKNELDWNFKKKYSFNIGDRVFLYASFPIGKITYEVEVDSTDIPYHNYIDDSQFGGTKYLSELEYSKSYHVRFRLIRIINCDALSYNNLLKHGLNRSIRTAIKCSKELYDYIMNSLDFNFKSITHKYRLIDLIDCITPPPSNIYKKYVPLFIKEAQKEKNWIDWDKDVFYYYFEKAKNGVAFLGNGQITKNDRLEIKKHWMELAPHLKKIANSQNFPLWDEYKEIRAIIRKYTTTNKRIATNRLLAGLQPNLLCTEIDINRLNELLEYIQNYTTTSVPNYDKTNWEIASNTFVNLIKQYLPDQDIFSHFYLPYKLLELFRDENFLNQLHQIDFDEIESPEEIYEGAKKEIMVNSYERNPLARQKCIDAHGCQCSICGLDFSKMYGKIGEGFIHVHHLVPISSIGEEYKIDPIKDLIPVCPNCHAMIHKFNIIDESTIQQLRSIIKDKRVCQNRHILFLYS